MNRDDLVVLQYASNNCHTNVVSIDKVTEEERGFEIDLEREVWSSEYWRDVPFGQSRDHGSHNKFGSSDWRMGVIGVYDRNNITHLDSIVRDGKEATGPRYIESRH